MSSLPEVPQRRGNRQMDTKDPIRTLEESKTSNIKVIPTLFNIQFQLACFSNGGITLNCQGLGCKGSFKLIIVKLNLRKGIKKNINFISIPLFSSCHSQAPFYTIWFVNKYFLRKDQSAYNLSLRLPDKMFVIAKFVVQLAPGIPLLARSELKCIFRSLRTLFVWFSRKLQILKLS